MARTRDSPRSGTRREVDLVNDADGSVPSSGGPGPTRVVVEFAGMSCTGKSYLISRVEARLNALGYSTTTRAYPYASSAGARILSRVRALVWAYRLESGRRRPWFWTIHRILNRGFLMRGTGTADVNLISEGLFHRVYFSVRDRIGPNAKLNSLADILVSDALSRPDLLVHVTAQPDVIVERRLARDRSRSQQATELADVTAAVTNTRELVEPAFRDFGGRYGFDVVSVDNSGHGDGDPVETIVSMIIAHL